MLILRLEGLTKLQRELAGAKSTAVQTMLKQWGARYMAEAQERFAENSRGGGSWAGLSLATVKAKRRKGSRTPDSILRDRSILFHALDPVFQNGPGQFRELGNFSIEIGVGGSATYPDSSVAIADVAMMHHMGEGRMPRRPILGPVSPEVEAGMVADAERALSKIYE